jgi:uncharacterized protein YajQ (UPF0234 family)
MDKYKYIGKADVKFLDKEETKLGAFLEMGYDELLDILIDAAIKANVPLQSVKFKVLPNKKEDGYTCKIIVK